MCILSISTTLNHGRLFSKLQPPKSFLLPQTHKERRHALACCSRQTGDPQTAKSVQTFQTFLKLRFFIAHRHAFCQQIPVRSDAKWQLNQDRLFTDTDCPDGLQTDDSPSMMQCASSRLFPFRCTPPRSTPPLWHWMPWRARKPYPPIGETIWGRWGKKRSISWCPCIRNLSLWGKRRL